MDDVKLGSYKFSAEYQDIKVESPKLDIIDGIRLFPMRFGIYCDSEEAKASVYPSGKLTLLDGRGGAIPVVKGYGYHLSPMILRNGWLYVYSHNTESVYIYECTNNKYTLTGIKKKDNASPKKDCMEKHINQTNDFILLLSDDVVQLFYTSIELSDSFINETYYNKQPIGSVFKCKEWSDGTTKSDIERRHVDADSIWFMPDKTVMPEDGYANAIAYDYERLIDSVKIQYQEKRTKFRDVFFVLDDPLGCVEKLVHDLNNARIEQEADLALCQVAIQCPDAIVKTETSEEQLNQIRTGMGEDMTKLLQESKTQAICFTAEEGVKEAAPVTLSFGYQDTDRKGNRIDLYLKENSEMTVVMDYHSSEGTGTAAIQTKIHAEKNAKLKLIQIERLGEGFDCMNDIGAYCEDGAGVELVQLIIGGKNVYMGAETTLAGKESDFTAAIGYQVTGENRLDMNYNAVHEGKKTTSSMTANGVLRDHAKKLFRGTIDFKKGAKGAKGDELEDVLLLDDGVQNQTIPLILCAEEDVEGNHGASIGSLDDELIFYLESRGISEEAAYELMAKARLKAVCKKIPVEGLRAELNEMLDGEEPVGEEQ